MQQITADQILAAAKPHPRAGWFALLSEEQKVVVREVRDRWKASQSTSGVSAMQMAKTLIAKMPDAKFPSPKELAAWLNRQQ